MATAVQKEIDAVYAAIAKTGTAHNPDIAATAIDSTIDEELAEAYEARAQGSAAERIAADCTVELATAILDHWNDTHEMHESDTKQAFDQLVDTYSHDRAAVMLRVTEAIELLNKHGYDIAVTWLAAMGMLVTTQEMQLTAAAADEWLAQHAQQTDDAQTGAEQAPDAIQAGTEQQPADVC